MPAVMRQRFRIDDQVGGLKKELEAPDNIDVSDPGT